jgi:hypothetical protein
MLASRIALAFACANSISACEVAMALAGAELIGAELGGGAGVDDADDLVKYILMMHVSCVLSACVYI